MSFAGLSDETLIADLRSLVGQGRALVARMLVYLGEVEERRIHLMEACSSMFDFCVHRLGMSEDEACRRVAAARLVRRFPSALDLLERGELHLSTLLLLRDHLTVDNHAELLRAVVGKTKREVHELLVARAPQPDVPTRISPLPEQMVVEQTFAEQVTPAAAAPSAPKVKALAPQRYALQLTVSGALREKLERATLLLRHSNPSGDLAVVLERAVDLLIAKLETQRLGKVERPTSGSREQTRRGYVTRAARRAVLARDGEQCSFVDAAGRRCPSRTFLEIDHVTARARGGGDAPENLRIFCRSHNQWAAERDFGRAHVDAMKRSKATSAGAPPAARPSEAVHPRRRGYARDTLLRALRGMGFAPTEVRRALARIDERHAGHDVPIETALREALRVLTS